MPTVETTNATITPPAEHIPTLHYRDIWRIG